MCEHCQLLFADPWGGASILSRSKLSKTVPQALEMLYAQRPTSDPSPLTDRLTDWPGRIKLS